MQFGVCLWCWVWVTVSGVFVICWCFTGLLIDWNLLVVDCSVCLLVLLLIGMLSVCISILFVLRY